MYTGSGCFPGKIFSDTYIIFYLELGKYIEARQSQEPPWVGTVWEALQWCTLSFSGRCMQWTYWQHIQHSSLTFSSSESQFCLGYCSKCFPNATRCCVSKNFTHLRWLLNFVIICLNRKKECIFQHVANINIFKWNHWIAFKNPFVRI